MKTYQFTFDKHSHDIERLSYKVQAESKQDARLKLDRYFFSDGGIYNDDIESLPPLDGGSDWVVVIRADMFGWGALSRRFARLISGLGTRKDEQAIEKSIRC